MTIGVSLASYLPWTAVNAMSVARGARQAGYTFIQVLPFRSVTVHLRHMLEPRYVEEAWNPAYTHRGADPKTPILLHDRLFFPSRQRCTELFTAFRRLGARWITHDLTDFHTTRDALLEVHPGLWLTPEEIARQCGAPRLVLDLYHLRRPPRTDELAHRPQRISAERSLLGDWRAALPVLLPLTRVIHVSPHRRDPTECTCFLEGRATEFEAMLIRCRGEFAGDYVVEVKMPLARSWGLPALCDMLRQFHRRLAAVTGR